MQLTTEEKLKNQTYHKIALLKDFSQNQNDYLHGNKYEKHAYKHKLTDKLRKNYCSSFLILSH